MGTHDFTPLFDHYPEVIAQLPPTFDSHEFILHLAQQHQPEYIDALCAYRDTLGHLKRPCVTLMLSTGASPRCSARYRLQRECLLWGSLAEWGAIMESL